jgi:hypothetical protein
MAKNDLAYLQYRDLVLSLGRAGTHALFPNDFEYYMCSLDLVNSDGGIVDSLVFPIMPDQMSYSSSHITNIKQTAGGVSILKSTVYVPMDISLSGTFGRHLKFMVGTSVVSFTALKFSYLSGVFSKEDMNWKQKTVFKKFPRFNQTITTGYGATKILQAICDKSVGLDDKDRPMRLFFRNAALNANHVVEVMNLTLNQEKGSSNMLWQYNLTLKAVLPLDAIKKDTKTSLIKILAFDNIAKAGNLIVSAIRNNLAPKL